MLSGNRLVEEVLSKNLNLLIPILSGTNIFLNFFKILTNFLIQINKII